MPFPTVSGYLDQFNRANEGPPPSSSWAGPITQGQGQLQTFSNVVIAAASGSNYWNTSFAADQECGLTIGDFVSDSAALYLRINTPNSANLDAYAIGFYQGGAGTNVIRVFKIIDNTATQLGGDISQTIANGDSIGAQVIGSTIYVWYKVGAGSWTNLDTRTNSEITAGGFVGISFGATNVYGDDFFGGAVVSVGTIPVFTGGQVYVTRGYKTVGY